MKPFLYPPKETWDDLCKRPVMDMSSLDNTVKSIIDRVRSEGDKALREYTLKFDKVSLNDLKVSDAETDESIRLVPDNLGKQ